MAKPPSLPTNTKANVMDELQSIIDTLSEAGVSFSEDLFTTLIRQLLSQLSYQFGQKLSLATLTDDQKDALEEELDRIAKAVEKTGSISNINIVLAHMKKRIRREYIKVREKDLAPLDKKSQKDYTQFLKLSVIYEIYKLTSPNQLAGQTALDNFITNSQIRGEDFAIDNTGIADESRLENLARAALRVLTSHHKKEIAEDTNSFLHRVEINKGKDGWER